MATPSPVYLLEHVKHGTQNIQNDCHGGFLTALECIKFVFGRGLDPDLTEGTYSALHIP